MSTLKAGGVLLRRSSEGDLQCYLIHRPRHDDWSLPKGHCDAGETPQAAAERELREETGFVGRMLTPLPAYYYDLPDNSKAVVHWFAMEVVEQHQPLDDEVDRGQWCTLEQAVSLLSYPSLVSYVNAIWSQCEGLEFSNQTDNEDTTTTK